MGQVIQIRRKNQAQPEVVEAAADLLRRAENGLITGLIVLASVRDAKNEIGVCGDFAEDMAYARHAANRGFATLLKMPEPK